MHEHDVLCFGETMAMFVAEHCGDLASVGQFGKRIAGADSNVAIGLARLGFKVRWLSRVGDDSLGRFVLDSLRREGLDCSAVEVDGHCATGFQLKARCDDGSDPAVEYFRRGRQPAGCRLRCCNLACCKRATCMPRASRRRCRTAAGHCRTGCSTPCVQPGAASRSTPTCGPRYGRTRPAWCAKSMPWRAKPTGSCQAWKRAAC